MFEEIIGKKSNRVKNTVSREAVVTFAAAIGDPHPIYVDESYGKTTRFKQNLAPPTFPRTFQYGEVPGLNLPKKGLIHGEQTYHYTRPLMVGEDVYCFLEVEAYVEKEGKSGKMGFLTLVGVGEDVDGDVLFSAKQVIVINASVRKAMSQ